MSITKNHQSPETIQAMCKAAFPGLSVTAVTELTEGMCNAAYRVDFSDGSASVLKIAAADASGLLSNEANLMQAEVAAMLLAHRMELPWVPKIQYSDFSRALCSGKYFFMEHLPGRSFNTCREELPESVQQHIHRQVGAFQQQMAMIHGERFGLLGDHHRFYSLYEMVQYMFRNVLHDAEAKNVDLGLSADALLFHLSQDQAAFDEVKSSSLVHWDMWEGNILVEDGEVSGIIDWERAMWGEPLMDDRFRRHNRPAAFLEGFGLKDFTPSQLRRLAWYDLFLYLTMVTESYYRQYEDIAGLLSWLRPLVAQAWADVQQH